MEALLESTGARAIERGPRIQRLWSGYGEIYRARLVGASPEAVVVKRVEPPAIDHHPRGWAGARSHARKLRSYDVELTFYRRFAPRLGGDARVAALVAGSQDERGWWLVLEDLDAAGFPLRRESASPAEARACLTWLARFHARFLGEPTDGLWPVGTYWHLATRPDELAAIEDPALARAAPLLDARLSACRFPTVVHGDAKLANFCFGLDGEVAGVDFQYAGGGPGVKDVAYFLSSLGDEVGVDGDGYLDTYFAALRAAVAERGAAIDLDALEAEGRSLYPLAWADFHRFLAGWAPGHWKRNSYCRRMTRAALDQLEGLELAAPEGRR